MHLPRRCYKTSGYTSPRQVEIRKLLPLHLAITVRVLVPRTSGRV